MAQGAPPHELNRLDTKNWSATPHNLEDQLVAGLHELVPQVDAVIVLDQVDLENTGVVTQRLAQKLSEISRQYPQLRIVADSRRGLLDWPPVTMKMNAMELARCTGAEPQADLTTIASLAKQLAAARQRDVIVTLSEPACLAPILRTCRTCAGITSARTNRYRWSR